MEAELELSTEKTKIVVFKKRRNKRRQRKWKWREQELEEVDEIRYLGHILQKNGSDEKHIQDRKKRATIAMKKTWSVGERIFKQDYKTRVKMFGALVGSVALFGSEVWAWNMEERLDRIERRYVKWILDLDMTKPNYILIEECKLKGIKEKVLKRAARYEGKSEKLGKWPRREKSKKEKEGTRGGEKWRDTDGSKKRAKKDDSRPNCRRKKKERSRREDKDKGIQI
ncbi:uncharacterized protein LOC112212310 [Bombus impatiens]|uniref:Uncharacterized protein LOC112212310 n=1 Tax=Bombus impatiens TaxID=132113 RepID=A0A6P8L1A0_BOMIM|nr:uncharacterized protein LOC112212310 [Bombus impatiens]